ncbi:hypothetical protein B1A99_05700 [Cohnella sp. CIP 111063]|jgi:Protein of unknown function (DUF2892).|uniref:YgaP family membrane protein n=1 Tax=unclassified Cohnella TaxID=2636738 RepID=UPI000B8C61A2|nr:MULTISPECIES: DUF2892 domain-containing protein [unclassified Cohnella]OXS61021.1 hypothetical protein B1A99_05700 [Cohnella sp. CIP 111063]PRX73565.1 Protein of unknown function (DUF2892) [Cohnella sp. SGD-V74]
MKNVGTIDRMTRIVIGLGVLSLVFVLEGGIRFVGLLGLVFVLTGLAGSCLMYRMLGVSTCKR